MTDEEKQAIEYLKVLHPMMWWQLPDRNGRLKTDVKLQTAIDTVLNLIEKQQRIIEEQKSRCSHLGRDAQKAVDYTFELNKEIEKKDKIIELMSKYIAKFDIEEDICNKIENNCCDYAGQNGKLCNDCIKEYFKKKVEDK